MRSSGVRVSRIESFTEMQHMSIASTGQFSLPPALRNPSSEAEAFDKNAQSPVSDAKKAATSEPVNQKESSREPLNPFANLPDRPFTPTPFPAPPPFPVFPGPPVPEPPLTADPRETGGLSGAGSQDNVNVSPTTTVPRPGSIPSFPTDFVPRGPFNPDPRPFVPGPQTPFPFPDSIVPGPPIPEPPLMLPPEEDALLRGAGATGSNGSAGSPTATPVSSPVIPRPSFTGSPLVLLPDGTVGHSGNSLDSAGSAAGQSADGLEGALTLTGPLPLNIDADEPITNGGEPIDLSEPIPFEPGGVVPGADFFTDFLGQPSAGQEVIDNARIQAAGPQATPQVTNEPAVNVPGNNGFLNPEKITGSRDADAPSVSTGNSNRLFAMSSSLKELLSRLENFLKL